MEYVYVSSLYRDLKLFNMYKPQSTLCSTMQICMKKEYKLSEVTNNKITNDCRNQMLRFMQEEMVYFIPPLTP